MAVNKVEIMENGSTRTIIDLTEDTVEPEALAEGYTAHDPSGQKITGKMPTTTVLYTEQTLTNEQKAQARENIGALSADIIVTPQMYGAVGDGINDDTQALFDALNENDEVFLPKGNYVISQSIDLSNGKKLFSNNHEGVIVFKGTGSVFYLGRRTRINGIKVRVENSGVSKIFDTDNRVFTSTNATLMTEVDDIEVYFSTGNSSIKATLINIVASNKDYIGVSGFHNQHYSNIQVTGESKIEYGIKICVSFDAPYEADVTGALPWITNMRFNHIWLGCPETAIKIHRENNSGTDIDFNSIVRTEHMMFTDIASQDTNSEHTKKFYDVEYCMAEFINCQPWDYHHVTNRGEKYNVIGAGALLSEVNARRSPIDVAEFPSVTATTPEEDPTYFLRTFFNFQSNIDGKYDFIDMKCDDKISSVGIDEVKVESIAQRVVEESMTGIYKNVMSDPLTQVHIQKRFSGSEQVWKECSHNDALVIPIESGMNLIRWIGNTLSEWYMGVFLSNDLTSCILVEEHPNITVTTESGDTYLEINNNAGYRYAILPFSHTEVTMNVDNMIVTINEVIGDGALKSIGDHINNTEIHITSTEREKLSALNSSCKLSYGTCSTAAATAEKAVTVDNENWELSVGSVVMVRFDVSNSASNVTLNVNETGAYPIWYNNAEYTSTGTAYTGYAKRVTTYMFNGTHWVWIANSYDSNTTYKNVALGHGYATCSTAEATAAKVGTLSSYALTVGGIVAVKFTNSVPANSTLNINSKGAKNIFYRGAKIVADVIKAGDIATFIYDGTQYQLISIDRLPGETSTTTTETWTFTLKDGSTVTKKVVLA